MSTCDLEGVSPNVPLTRPRRVRHILCDGNCHAYFPYIITGTEDQHLQVRGALLNHLILISIESMMIGHHISG